MGESPQPQAVFQLFDAALAATMPEILGLWATRPAASPTLVAFDVSTVPSTDTLVWCVHLPADLHLAYGLLESGTARLRAAQQGLTAAPARLTRLVEASAVWQSFEMIPGREPFPGAEQELLSVLAEIAPAGAPRSFGLMEKLTGTWEQARQQFETLVERLRQCVAAYVAVETWVQEELLGRTTVSWTGDVDTVWYTGLRAEQRALHQCTLALALQSRDTLIQTFGMATQCAIKLSVLVSVPGGLILALPAAWRFVHQVLAEYSQQP